MSGTTYYLGAAYRKSALLRLVGALDTRGRRGAPSLSELVGRVADAAIFDFEQTAARLGEVFAVAERFTPPVDGDETAVARPRTLNLHLGTRNAAGRHAALQRLADHFGISVSMILMRLADAIMADEQLTVTLVADIVNVAVRESAGGDADTVAATALAEVVRTILAAAPGVVQSIMAVHNVLDGQVSGIVIDPARPGHIDKQRLEPNTTYLVLGVKVDTGTLPAGVHIVTGWRPY